MAIRSYHRSRYQIKADQEWDMAGLARQDGDMKDAELHMKKAREYEAMAREERDNAE